MFRFSIRDLLWLTVVVALVVGWWRHERALAEKHSAATIEAQCWHGRAEACAERLRTHGHTVEWTDGAVFFWSFGSGGVRVKRTTPLTLPTAAIVLPKPSAPAPNPPSN